MRHAMKGEASSPASGEPLGFLHRWLSVVFIVFCALLLATAVEELWQFQNRVVLAGSVGSNCWELALGLHAGPIGTRRSLRGPGNPPSRCIQLNLEIPAVMAVAEQAAAAVLEVYSLPAEGWQVEQKPDSSPVTLADKASNNILTKGLQRLVPGIPIVSEESPAVPYHKRKAHPFSWSIDPLDGTKEFLKHTGEFTVNVALLHGTRPVLGVVVVPTQGKVYWAVEGQGAWMRDSAGQQRRLAAAQFDLRDEGLVVLGSPAVPTGRDFLHRLNKPVYREVGSSLKMLMVAEGTAHIFPRLAPTLEWDTAAAQVILEEAGGALVAAGKDWQAALERQEPLAYNKRNPSNPHFIAHAKRRHAAASAA